MGLYPCRHAGRDHGRVRELAAHSLWEGAEGWVYHTLLSGKRTAVVVPKSKEELVPLYESADVELPVTAKLQSGVLGALKSCNGSWCQIIGRGFDGYIQQERLWGAYPNEKVD